MNKLFKVNNFDLIRIFAATQVLILHTIDHLHIEKSIWYMPLDYFPGVPIFYAISGYLISASYERSKSLKNYFRNRFLRIYPGLWGCLLITILVASLLGFNFISKSAFVWFISQTIGLIYTPDFLANFGFGSYNGSLWTISIELQFYIALPLTYLLLNKSRYNIIVLYLLFFIFLAIAIVTKVFLTGMFTAHESTFEKLIRYSFLPHYYVFLAGVLMQRLKIYKSKYIYGKGFYWVAGYILTESVVSYLHIPLLALLSILLLSICVISLAYTGTGLSHELLKGNDISYGVYIYHGLLLNILVSYKLLHQPYYLLVVLFGAFALGYCSWIFVEKPFLSRKTQIYSDQLTKNSVLESPISETGAGV